MDHLRDLKADPHNRRKHNPRNIGMVVDALHAVGAARSIVIDEDNVILAGNGVVEAAAEAGIEKVRVIEANGNEIIAVRRTGLSDEQKFKLALYDNRGGELAEWDASQIAADLDVGVSFDGLFSDRELAVLIAELSDIEVIGVSEDDLSTRDRNVMKRLKPDREKEALMTWGDIGVVLPRSLYEKVYAFVDGADSRSAAITELLTEGLRACFVSP